MKTVNMSDGLFMNMLDCLGSFDADLMPNAESASLYKIFLEFYFIKFYPYKTSFENPLQVKQWCFFYCCCWLPCYSNKWDKGDIIIHRDDWFCFGADICDVRKKENL